MSAAVILLVLLVTACTPSEPAARGRVAAGAAWADVVDAARGQTVRWWMYGGDTRANRYVDEHVIPAAARLGVTVRRVPVSDTVDAVQRLRSEQAAGQRIGSIDLVWVNGTNFALGKEAGLWLRGWARRLPNASLIDWDDETITTDFGVPIDAQEAPWGRAAFVFAHDRQRVVTPPADVRSLLAWARAHPGRFTYPAPPDFTGSAFVRQVVAAVGEDEAFTLLRELRPHQWRSGAAFPESEAELNRLFGDGQVDIAMSYDPAFVAAEVGRGTFPPTARPFLLTDGTLQNTSYVAVPRSAPHRAGALVVADLLLDVEQQAVKASPQVWGLPTVLDIDELGREDRRRFARTDDPYVPGDLGAPIPEFSVERVSALDDRWTKEVLR